MLQRLLPPARPLHLLPKRNKASRAGLFSAFTTSQARCSRLPRRNHLWNSDALVRCSSQSEAANSQ